MAKNPNLNRFRFCNKGYSREVAASLFHFIDIIQYKVIICQVFIKIICQVFFAFFIIYRQILRVYKFFQIQHHTHTLCTTTICQIYLIISHQTWNNINNTFIKHYRLQTCKLTQPIYHFSRLSNKIVAKYA